MRTRFNRARRSSIAASTPIPNTPTSCERNSSQCARLPMHPVLCPSSFFSFPSEFYINLIIQPPSEFCPNTLHLMNPLVAGDDMYIEFPSPLPVTSTPSFPPHLFSSLSLGFGLNRSRKSYTDRERRGSQVPGSTNDQHRIGRTHICGPCR